MADDSAISTGPSTGPWPVLDVRERRVLGVLVEKAKTTPDVYPLSLNALVTGCNQKSNRDPVLDLAEAEVDEVLTALQPKGLVTRIQGGRVEKFRHNLYDVLAVDKAELATLAEMLLRGPQTEGELRGRASRMEPIPDLETLRGVLRRLAQRGLVVFLGPEGRRGTLITHGFLAADELAHLQSAPRETEVPRSSLAEAAGRVSQDSSLAQVQADLAAARADITQLREQVVQLQESLAHLSDRVRRLEGQGG
jgi:uncharacterized protein YceH (UPF0502 family)